MSDGTTTAKLCIACGTDCAGKPRTKDAQGRYMCKPCFEKARTKAAAKPAPKPEPIPVEDDGGVLASLLESEGKSVNTEPCPSCGAGLQGGAVICTTCGHDLRTGKSVRSIVSKEKERSEGAAKAAAVAGAVASVPAVLLIGCLCAAIGAAVGGAVWAGVAYNLHVRITYIAILIGVLAGAGMKLGARSQTGGITGALAALIAACGVFAGHYWTLSAFVDKVTQRANTRAMVNDEFVMVQLAKLVAQEHEQAGVKDKWPDGSSAEDATSPGEFPASVWKEAESRWTSLGPEKQEQMKADMRAEMKDRLSAMKSEIVKEGFFETMGIFNWVCMLVAVVCAFVIGSGGSFD